jgi:putative endonuclease
VNAKDSTLGRANARNPGLRAERLAATFLEGNGLSILARNYRCRGGEVDLICQDRGVLVFVEVRLRRNPATAVQRPVSPAQTGRIILAARHYLASHSGLREPDCRFDCLLLDALSEAAIEWLRDAFAGSVRQATNACRHSQVPECSNHRRQLFEPWCARRNLRAALVLRSRAPLSAESKRSPWI